MKHFGTGKMFWSYAKRNSEFKGKETEYLFEVSTTCLLRSVVPQDRYRKWIKLKKYVKMGCELYSKQPETHVGLL